MYRVFPRPPSFGWTTHDEEGIPFSSDAVVIFSVDLAERTNKLELPDIIWESDGLKQSKKSNVNQSLTHESITIGDIEWTAGTLNLFF